MPICLPDKGVKSIEEEYGGRTATITGWGALNDYDDTSSVLQEIQVPISNGDDCPFMSADHFCEEGEGDDKQACEGDSGGPVALRVNLFEEKKNIHLKGQPNLQTPIADFHKEIPTCGTGELGLARRWCSLPQQNWCQHRHSM